MGILRLILALSVVAAHFGGIFGMKFVGGQMAVQAFYIISGFYMSYILNQKYIGAKSSYKLFIGNRFLRLYPVYWTVLLFTVFFCIYVNYKTSGNSFPVFGNYQKVEANLFSFIFLALSNIFIFGQDMVMFLGINSASGQLFFTDNFTNTSPQLFTFLFVPQAWTLELEMLFYLIAPFILRRKPPVIFIIIICSIAIRIWSFNYFNTINDPWTYRFFPFEIAFFLSGYICYRLFLKIRQYSCKPKIAWYFLFGMLLFTILFYHLPSVGLKFLPFSLKELFYFLGIIITIPILFHHLKNRTWDNRLGELSYPVYISHMFVGMVCSFQAEKFFKQSWVIALCTIILPFLLNKFISQPIEKIRQARLASKV